MDIRLRVLVSNLAELLQFHIDTQKFKLVSKFTLLLRLEIVNLALVLAGHCDFFGRNFISLDRNAL